MKSEGTDEICEAVAAMRELVDKVELNTFDGFDDYHRKLHSYQAQKLRSGG